MGLPVSERVSSLLTLSDISWNGSEKPKWECPYLLIPMSRMADAGGPMKMTPSFSHCSANSVFSDRNPYPGWTAYIQHGSRQYYIETRHSVIAGYSSSSSSRRTYRLTYTWMALNSLKCNCLTSLHFKVRSDVRWLHLKVFSAIQV